MAHRRQHPYDSYNLLGPAVPKPFVVRAAGPPLLKNACFRSETVEKRLDLTSYMRYVYAEGRKPPWPTADSIHMTHIIY